MRKLNAHKLNEWLAINGELSREDLASKSRIKFHILKRIIDGKRMPRELEQIALCQATGLTKDELFPLIVEIKKESA